MTATTISRNGWLYWLAYGPKAKYRPERTVNGCSVIWLASIKALIMFVAAVILSVAGIGLLLILIDIARGLWAGVMEIVAWLAHPSLPDMTHHDFVTLTAIGAIFTLAAALFGIMYLAVGPGEMPRLVRVWLKAKKDKFCPIWEVV